MNDGTILQAEELIPVATESEAECLELGGAGSLARRPFDPVACELDATFRLTKYADLKG